MTLEVIERPAITVVGMNIRTRAMSPAGTCTTCRYPLSGLGKGFGELFNRLLPQSGYVQTPGPTFERYDESFDARDPGSLVEICLPVRRRT